MEWMYMNEEEINMFGNDIENQVISSRIMDINFKNWFMKLPISAKNDFVYNFIKSRNVKDCMDLVSYFFGKFRLEIENAKLLTDKVIINGDLKSMSELIHNYALENKLPSSCIKKLAENICESINMDYVYPVFKTFSKKSLYTPAFISILKSKDIVYIERLIGFMSKKSHIVRQDDLEKLIDAILRIDDNSSISLLYRVVEDVMQTDISRCIKEENIKYILEKSKSFFELNKKQDLENIVLKSKDVHQIINLVHRENLNGLDIDYQRVVNSIISNNIFDLDDNKIILGHVIKMMERHKFSLESYILLEKYLLVTHMELIPEYVKLNPKTNYKYITFEMKNKHASEEQINEFKDNIKRNNNLFKKIIDNINYSKYIRK